MQHARTHNHRGGFTLVEMLVVIAIIGVLVALLVPTVAGVMRRARNAAIAVELQDLASAMNAYKAFANDYPPDFTDVNAVDAHVRRAFPRNTTNVATWWGLQDSAGRSYSNLDPAEALVFWLSRLSTNPRDPLSGADAGYSGERKVFFGFDETRIRIKDVSRNLVDIDNDGWEEYVPKYGIERPYVYFDGRVIGNRYAYNTASYPKQASAPTHMGSVEVVRPFRSTTPIGNRDNDRTKPDDAANGTEWIKPGQFQIICAGQDNEFGFDIPGNSVVFKQYPTPNYTIAGPDEDNLADFSETRTLGDSVP